MGENAMRPEDVPAELVQAAMAVDWDLAYPDTAARSILAAALTQLGMREQWRAESDLGWSALPAVEPFLTKEAAEQALTRCRSFGLPVKLRRRYVTDWEDADA